MDRNNSCAERVASQWEGRKIDLTKFMNGKEDEDSGRFADFALSFDYVAPNTFPHQVVGYWRYQISWGGPSDEIRFFGDDPAGFAHAEYWFMDWHDGAHINVSGEACVSWLWDELTSLGVVKEQFYEAMIDYEPPAVDSPAAELTINIELENAAFEDEGCGDEVARILRKIANDLAGQDRAYVSIYYERLRDINGNDAGYVEGEETDK